MTLKSLPLISLLCCFITLACQTTKNHGKARDFREVSALVALRKPDLNQFVEPGPVSYVTHKDFEITLSPSESVLTDFYQPTQDSGAPLLLIQHGNLSSKDFHSEQAKRAASWGLNVLVIEQPNRGRWIRNGYNLKNLVNLLHHSPSLLNEAFDPNKIILAGHSFGGSATVVAASAGAKLKGIILLDPAIVHKKVERMLSKVNQPTILLGADRKVFKSRRRQLFFKRIKNNILEFSLAGSTHNDAQYPNMFSWRQSVGLAPATNDTRQKKFSAAIIASTYSLANTEVQDAQSYILQALKTTDFDVKDIRYK